MWKFVKWKVAILAWQRAWFGQQARPPRPSIGPFPALVSREVARLRPPPRVAEDTSSPP